MKNAGLTIGMCAIGLGLASIGINLNGNAATATPAAFNAGPGEPTIVWYDSQFVGSGSFNGGEGTYDLALVFRAWSDGTVEARRVRAVTSANYCNGNTEGSACEATQGWFVISSPNEGLNAAADINFDARVDGADLARVLAAWGDAPRNAYPPSDCPLGLIP